MNFFWQLVGVVVGFSAAWIFTLLLVICVIKATEYVVDRLS